MPGMEWTSETAKILVVDDKPYLLGALSRVLAGAGHQVIEATTGQAALRLARETKPSLVMLDLTLPDIDGLQLCHRIKADAALTGTPVLLLGGKEIDFDCRADVLKAGADGYLVRPISDCELLSWVEAMLRIQRLEKLQLAQTHELQERLKEMDCLYGISQLEERAGASLSEFLQAAVDLLPPAWQYPEVACARICLEGQEFKTEGFRETIWRQVSNIWLRGERAGTLEVCYLEERPECQDGPFLSEEQSLLDAIAGRLGWVLERLRAQEALEASQELYRTVSQLTSDLAYAFRVEPDGSLVREWMTGALSDITGYSSTELSARGGWASVIHPDDQPAAEQHMQRLLSGQQSAYELRITTRGGEVRWMHDSGLPIWDEGQGRVVRIHGAAKDITERKRAEEVLLRYQTIVATVSDPISYVDSSYIYRAVNDAYVHYANRPREQIVGLSIPELLGADAFEKQVQPHLERCLAGEEVHYQAWFEAPGRGSRFMDVAYHPVRRADGVIDGVVVASRDMTEQRQAQDALQQERELLSRIMETSPVGIVTFDAQGRITYANALVSEISGLSQPALTAQSYFSPLWHLTDPDGKPLPAEALPFSEAVRTRAVVRDVRLGAELADGRRLSLLASSAPVFNKAGELDGVVVVVEDITERVEADRRLRESEATYRQLVENISDVIYALDPKGMITYISPVIESLLGYRPDQILGQPFANFVPAEDLAQMISNFQRLASGEVLGPSEYRLVSATGDLHWVRVSSQPIVQADRVVGVRGVMTDFTDRRRQEEQREEAATAAERARLARELHDAVTQSLFSVSAIAEALPTVWERDPVEARRGLKELRWLAGGALAEMRAMLLELRPSAVTEQDLGSLVAQLAEAITARTRVDVITEIEGRCKLPADVQLGLYRIAQEALNNVVKHARSSQVHVLLLCRPDRVRMSIRDDGRGFDPDVAGPHQMGMAIMRERAQAIGAEFHLVTAPGQGTEITVVWHGVDTDTKD